MNRTAFLILALIFPVFSGILFAQTQTVKGTVTDKDSEYPLIEAEIVIHHHNGKTYGAVTDFDGKYRITGVPIGKIDISVHYLGYDDQRLNNIDLVAGKELVINFSLTEQLNQLDQVVIRTRSRKHVEYSVSSTYAMDAEQINRYAGSLNDVSRMAMNYAGVGTNNDTRNDIIVRGNNPSSLLWEMEGTPIPNPNHYSAVGSSGGPVNMVNTNLLGKADFLTGAFPANFGNTSSAVFNLGFRTPNSDKYEFLGQIGFAGAELGVEGPISASRGMSWVANYRYSTLELFDKMGINLGVGTAVPEYQDASFVVHLPSQKSPSKLRIWGIGGISNIRFVSHTDDNDDNLYLDFENTDMRNHNESYITGMDYTYFFNKKTRLFTGLSLSRLYQFIHIDTLDTDTGIYHTFYKHTINNDYLTGKVELKSKVNKKNTLSIGSEYTGIHTDMDMYLNKINITYNNDLDKKTGLLGTYAMWKHRFSDQISINSGMRLQYFLLNDQISPEPRLGFNYKYQPHSKVFIAYGLHSNIHSLMAYYSKQPVAPGSTQWDYHNLDLKMMRSHHIVAGMETRLFDRWNFKAEAYYQYLFDVPVYHEGDTTYSIINSGYTDAGGAQLFFRRLYNDGAGKNYGLDLTLEYPINNGYYLLFTGSLYSSMFRPYDGKWRHTAWDGGYMSKLLTGKEFVFSPHSSLFVDVNINYAGGRRYTPIDPVASALMDEAVYDNQHAFENRFPFYFRTDLKIGYKHSGKTITQEWQLDLRNITNRRNVFSQRYNNHTDQVENTYQTGFFPVMQYKILF